MVRIYATAPPNTACLRCGLAFHVKPSILAKGSGRYCSLPCKWGPRVVRHCPVCATAVSAVASRAASYRGVFCSKRCHSASMVIPIEEQLARAVQHDETPGACWGWSGRTQRDGYGVLSQNRRGHQEAWKIASGAPIPDGMVVAHTCDAPACTRNDEQGVYVIEGAILPRWGHLFLATPGQNTRDRYLKGRTRNYFQILATAGLRPLGRSRPPRG